MKNEAIVMPAATNEHDLVEHESIQDPTMMLSRRFQELGLGLRAADSLAYLTMVKSNTELGQKEQREFDRLSKTLEKLKKVKTVG